MKRRGKEIGTKQKYDVGMLLKLTLIFFGLLFMVCIWLGRRERSAAPPEGEKIAVEDVEVLLQAVNVSVQDMPFLYEAKDYEEGNIENDNETYEPERRALNLTYGQYIQIREAINTNEMNLPDYAGRYEEAHELLKGDWYAAYRLMLAHLDTESSVWETTVFLMAVDTEEKKAYTENGGMQSPFYYHTSAFEQNVLRPVKAYVKGDDLLTVTETIPEEYVLENVWVMESTEGRLQCFYHQICFQAEAEQPTERERVADLTFRDGRVIASREKDEKIHGRLLRMTEEEIEIEDCGVYRIAEGMEVYKLYGSLETKRQADLRIGYADTDYVVDKGRICAALISREEAADRIRVLLRNPQNGGIYYDQLELEVDGEIMQIRAADLKSGERRSFRSAALTDKVRVFTAGDKREDNAYRGTIECCRMEEGMALINELPLEEYLYAVVPSEMPASYPLEALKAQAVCARTYAYRCILHAGLPEFGAHVDDTTSYQVYHNISENAATTTAVKDTDGILLSYQGEPAQNYYYSTSCGVGTDASVWKADNTEEIAYLQAVRLNRAVYDAGEGDEPWPDSLEKPEDLRQEEVFHRFITTAKETDLEKEEPWYRWTYTVDELDEAVLLARIQERYGISPASVLTKAEGDYYVSQPVEKLGKVKDLSIARRGAGGVAEELLIETDTGTYKILSEYNIRSVLCDRKSEAVRQDNSAVVPASLLPSGFFVLETGKKDGNVIGYTLSGGGYGHGVGMSQNGARALGIEGASYRAILEYFFPGCELDVIRHSS